MNLFLQSSFVLSLQAPWEVKDKCPPETWPEHGSVQFSQYSTRYRAGLDLVLRNVNFCVKPGERVSLIF